MLELIIVITVGIATKNVLEHIKNIVSKLRIAKQNVSATIILWCCQIETTLEKELKQVFGDIIVISSRTTPMSAISSFISVLPYYTQRSIAVFLSSEITVHDGLLDFLVKQINEHDSGSDVLSAIGFNIFPHNKCTLAEFTECIHWKKYNETRTGREVHIFTDDFCVIPLSILSKLGKMQETDHQPYHKNCIWLSYLMNRKLTDMQVHVWKIKTTGFISFSADHRPNIESLMNEDTDNYSNFHILYSELYDSQWPKGVTEFCGHVKSVDSSAVSCSSLWQNGFGGVNMAIHPASSLDLDAAAAYGVKVIRIGAVADAKDLSYLLNPESQSAKDDEKHLQRMLPRFRSAVMAAGAKGLRMIITMVDLPGCYFHSGSNSQQFWESDECRVRIIKYWSTLAKNLLDLRHLIMGYDIINEPYTTEDNCDYFDDISMTHTETLQKFYVDVVNAIREIDPTVAIILKCTWFSSPRAINALRPIHDDNVYYGFHAYIPPLLTLSRILDASPSSYPGLVQKWLNKSDEKILVDYDFLHTLLQETVVSWQTKYNVDSRHIIVAEFGISREVKGASSYLSDLIEIFTKFKWSWLLFSFRDEEWDALDYELGENMTNMLYRSPTKLFTIVSKHFH